MTRVWPWPQYRPRPALRRAVLLPALLAALGVLAAAKIALLAHNGVAILAGPAASERGAVAGAGAASVDVEPAAGPAVGRPDARLPEPEAGDPALVRENAPPPARRRALERPSQSEIEVLHQLADRRAALDRRERQLERHAALLATAEASLAAQLERLEQLRAEIAATVAAHDAEVEARVNGLVKIYETMKPKAAAEIFNRLEMPILIRVVECMRSPKSADVLARMDPAKAKEVTAELSRRTELLRAGGNSRPAVDG